MNGTDGLIKRPTELPSPITMGGCHEKLAVCNQQEGPQQNPTTLSPCFWTSSLQNGEQ